MVELFLFIAGALQHLWDYHSDITTSQVTVSFFNKHLRQLSFPIIHKIVLKSQFLEGLLNLMV
jgi:hypothetical protein